jgi:hypothetical protein
MSNIIVDTLPTAVEIDGVEYPLNTDFRSCLRIIMAFEDDTLTDYEKQLIMLKTLYPIIPANIEEALKQGTKFLNGGKDNEPNDENVPTRLYLFSKDSNLIFSAFKQTHNINLQNEKLHWWEFLSLFMDLGSNTAFCNLLGLRKRVYDGTATKEEKQVADEMGDIFDIPQPDLRTPEERQKEFEFLQLVNGGR